ncbi:hypothetical protein Y1Q_0003068 [Alligator mississippiensis]|uniref:Uncharacterized protein n=1 Tax=Alligator mississippiensis TaxID=8496 RepID=A0A151MDB1_ALLMI|nr:hypothetical protein Y1Q_0003068 [Alligator mississippiensis]
MRVGNTQAAPAGTDPGEGGRAGVCQGHKRSPSAPCRRGWRCGGWDGASCYLQPGQLLELATRCSSARLGRTAAGSKTAMKIRGHEGALPSHFPVACMYYSFRT